MSLNLHCNEVELCQTPTWITEICYFRHDGKKNDWKTILFLYLKWYESQAWEHRGNDDAETVRDRIALHTNALKRAAKKYKKLTFEAW